MMHPEGSPSPLTGWWMLEYKPDHLEQAMMPSLLELLAAGAIELTSSGFETDQDRARARASLPTRHRMQASIGLFPMVWQAFSPTQARFPPREKQSERRRSELQREEQT